MNSSRTPRKASGQPRPQPKNNIRTASQQTSPKQATPQPEIQSQQNQPQSAPQSKIVKVWQWVKIMIDVNSLLETMGVDVSFNLTDFLIELIERLSQLT